MITEARIKAEKSKWGKVSDNSDQFTSGLQAQDLPIVSVGREDSEGPTTRPRASPKKPAGDAISEDLKASTCKESGQKETRTKRTKGFRKDLSGIAQELLELRLHMIKEEERFRQQEQNLVNEQMQLEKTRGGGASKPEARTKPKNSKGQQEQRRKQRSPLKNQTNLVVDDLQGKVSALLKHRREMREQDRLLRQQLEEMRAQWEESVHQVEQARVEKSKILNKLASVIS